MAVFDSPWDRRLRRDLKEMEQLKTISSVLDFEAFGDPAARYLITFKGRGLVKEDGEIRFIDRHQTEIQLTLEYPRVPPVFRWLTPIHHPNIWGHGTVCLRDFWSPLKSRLVDAVAILWDMARLQILNPRSAYTGGMDASKEWAELDRRFGPFPVDRRPIDNLAPRLPEDPEEEADIIIMGARLSGRRELDRAIDDLERMLLEKPERVQEEVGDLGLCTEVSRWIAEKSGGEVYGYYSEENPSATLAVCEGGHDFVVVDGRWLVDWWAWDLQYIDRKVFDLRDPQEAQMVSALYGDKQTWASVYPVPGRPFRERAAQ